MSAATAAEPAAEPLTRSWTDPKRYLWLLGLSSRSCRSSPAAWSS